ncbi:cysteine-rich RLK (RECEPTOR-like protein kinase) 8, partial [Striga hermonthica]
PDVSFSVNKVCQFMHSPLDKHLKAVKKILRYLAGTKDYGLKIDKCMDFKITGFSDVDWGSDMDDRRSTSGMCVYMRDNLVSWSFKKQAVVSTSTTEAEYRSATQVVCEIMWIHSLLNDLKVSFQKPSVVWVDNRDAVCLAGNP